MKSQFDIKEFGIIPPPYGGCSVYVKRLIDKLNSDGYKVGGFYLESCDDKNIYLSPLYDHWNWMETHLLPFKIWSYLKIVQSYKIIHSHFSLEGMSYLWMLMKLGKKKVVITIHNSMVSTFYRQTNIVNRFFLNRMLQSKDVTWIAVSAEGKEQLLSLPIRPLSNVHVIPAYIPVVEECFIPLASEMQSYINNHKYNIAFYGHSFMINEGTDVYGFQTIIDIYSRLLETFSNNVGLVLCLSDTHDVEKIQELREYAKNKNVDDCIYWQIGAINNIRTLWKSVDVYVRPTSTDGDSVAVREALDEGISVIASDVCDRPKGVVVYKYGNEDDLYAKLVLCFNNYRKKTKPNYDYYNYMKDIYDNLLFSNL